MRLYQGHLIRCQVCGTEKHVARSDARFCSGKCRMRYMRKCDAITRGAGIAATAIGGAFPPPSVTVVSADPTVTPRPVTAAPRTTVTEPSPKPAAKKPAAKKPAAKKPVSPERKARFADKGRRLSAAKAAKKGRAK